MRELRCVFAVVSDPRIIAPAVADWGAPDAPVEILLSRDDDEMAQSARRHPRSLAVVTVGRAGGPRRAAHLARMGARMVLCLDGDEAGLKSLQALAPESFILPARTSADLARMLRATLG